MNDNTLKVIADLQVKMNNITENLITIKQKINAIELDTKRCLKSNTPIPPGIGCKFSYDSNGLILKSIPLSSSDIPQLEIDTIKSLRSVLNEKLGRAEFEKIQIQSFNNIIKRSDKIFGTGCKINFDKNGFVVSASDLTKEDIPIIDLEGVNGLIDRLKLIEDSIKDKHEDIDSFSIIPGTGIKISYDSKGRVIKTEGLSLDDIPNELINKLNGIETRMLDFASQSAVNNILSIIENKLNSNNKIQSGIFTKVQVDSNGLIVKGDRLSKEDLPTFGISDINGLESIIKNKVDRSEINNISDTISSLLSFVNKVGDITAIKTSLDNKAENSQIEYLKTILSNIQNSIDIINSKIPIDSISKCIEELQNEMISISGRLSVIERKLNIDL